GSGGTCCRRARRSSLNSSSGPAARQRAEMVRKTDGEKIDELVVLITTLKERLDNVRDELKDLKKDLDESRRRLWLIVPPVVAALLSAGLMAVVNYLTRH